MSSNKNECKDSILTRHDLVRICATSKKNQKYKLEKALELRVKIMTRYSETLLYGPCFRLPSGTIVVNDMWASSLNDKIDEMIDYQFENLKVFADEYNSEGWFFKWLKQKVEDEGTDLQKKQYMNLYNQKKEMLIV